MLLIGVASGLAAISDSGTALIGARIVQGFGGAMILPTTLVAGAIIVWRTVRRTRAGKPTLFKFDLFSIASFRTATSPP